MTKQSLSFMTKQRKNWARARIGQWDLSYIMLTDPVSARLARTKSWKKTKCLAERSKTAQAIWNESLLPIKSLLSHSTFNRVHLFAFSTFVSAELLLSSIVKSFRWFLLYNTFFFIFFYYFIILNMISTKDFLPFEANSVRISNADKRKGCGIEKSKFT